jgi:glutathione S-transferase
MAEIDTKREDIRQLEGLHLFHNGLSNCSQRVRIALCEKGLRWESHHVDLRRDENLKRSFRDLNPNAVVPVLVHDGRTIIESNDIIAYVDENFGGRELRPADADDRAFTVRTLATSSALQPTLKILSFEFLFKPARRMNAARLAEYEVKCKDPEKIAFMRELSSKSGFGEEKIRANVAKLRDAFDALDRRLTDAPWLGGHTHGLADISWTVNAHRAYLFRYPVRDHPRLAEWLRRVKSRQSFAVAVEAFEPRPLRIAASLYTRLRTIRGTSIASYL